MKKQHNISFKKRSKPTLTHKLHELTKATPIGVTVHNTNLGQGKRQVWIGTQASGRLRTLHEPPSSIQLVNTSVHVEAKRATAITKLRKKLISLCLKFSASPPSLAFERWLLDCLLVEEIMPLKLKSSNDPKIKDDPLFGPLWRRNNLESCSLVKDLIRATIAEKNAINIAEELQSLAHSVMTSSTSASFTTSVIVVHHRHTLDIKYGDKSKRLLKLNHEHYRKLYDLWKLAKYGNDVSRNESRDESRDESRELFHDDLYVMLSRYFAIQGHGFQAACPEHVFRVLHRTLGVSFECFASPLNCFFGSYCSAFPDVDGSFGSSGSFWKWEPPKDGGSFQGKHP
jgi:hypothetical protein